MLSSLGRFFEKDVQRTSRFFEAHPRLCFLLKLGYLHEIFHYLAARLVGIKVLDFTCQHVIVDESCPNWKLQVIGLAPAAVGVVGIAAALVLAFCSGPRWVNTVGDLLVGLAGGWLVACWYDLRSAWALLKET
ncbi:MAG: hypothetical protein JXB85_05090 [Anaerolineales bacterium]|nr:hypothetical protein [Anaerolineales bacterium]